MATTALNPFVRLATFAALVVLLGSCTDATSQVQVALGSLPSGPWTAWVYESYSTGLCLEVRLAGGADSICSLEDAGGIMRTHPNGEAGVLAGATSDPAATLVRVSTLDGAILEGEVVAARPVTDLRFFALALPARVAPSQLEILDKDGDVLETVSLD